MLGLSFVSPGIGGLGPAVSENTSSYPKSFDGKQRRKDSHRLASRLGTTSKESGHDFWTPMNSRAFCPTVAVTDVGGSSHPQESSYELLGEWANR